MEIGTCMRLALGSYQMRFSITSRAAHGQWPHSPMYQATPNAIRSISARNFAECGVDSCNPTPQAVKEMPVRAWTYTARSQGQQIMKDLRGQARVSAFLRKSLAEGAQDVLKLEAMARGEALLGERQRITDAKAFKRAKYSLRIRSVRAGFGPNGSWRWELPSD